MSPTLRTVAIGCGLAAKSLHVPILNALAQAELVGVCDSNEEAAREVIGLLDGGADFAELAKERSTGPSGPKGGDLGYFSAGQMVPEFSQAAAALEPGSYTKEPVKTQFGWHVIKLEDRRIAAPPPFEEIEQQLREQVARETLKVVLDGLREDADIEIVPQSAEATGEAAPEPAPEPAPAQ